MKIAQLETFVVVAEELHFRRAADRLFTQPSTVSTQISQLETEYGTPLFIRNSRNVTLSPAGQTLLQKAKHVLAGINDLEQTAKSLAAGDNISLTVGVMDEGLGELANVVNRNFRARYPGADFDSTVTDYASLQSRLLDATIDLCIVVQAGFVFLEPEDATIVPLLSEERVAAFSVSHPLATEQSLTSSQLVNEDFLRVVTAPPALNDFFTLADLRGRRSHDDLPVAAASMHDILNVIAEGRAISTFTAANQRFYQRPDIVYVPVTDLAPAITSIAHRPGETRPHVLAYIEECINAVNTSLDLIPTATNATKGTS